MMPKLKDPTFEIQSEPPNRKAQITDWTNSETVANFSFRNKNYINFTSRYEDFSIGEIAKFITAYPTRSRTVLKDSSIYPSRWDMELALWGKERAGNVFLRYSLKNSDKWFTYEKGKIVSITDGDNAEVLCYADGITRNLPFNYLDFEGPTLCFEAGDTVLIYREGAEAKREVIGFLDMAPRPAASFSYNASWRFNDAAHCAGGPVAAPEEIHGYIALEVKTRKRRLNNFHISFWMDHNNYKGLLQYTEILRIANANWSFSAYSPDLIEAQRLILFTWDQTEARYGYESRFLTGSPLRSAILTTASKTGTMYCGYFIGNLWEDWEESYQNVTLLNSEQSANSLNWQLNENIQYYLGITTAPGTVVKPYYSSYYGKFTDQGCWFRPCMLDYVIPPWVTEYAPANPDHLITGQYIR